MKRIWLALGLLAAIIVLCTVTLFSTHKKATELAEDVKTLRLAQAEDDSVPGRLKRLEDKWKECDKTLSLHLRHSELEEVNRNITLLGSYWREGQYDLYRVTCDEALIAIEHLWETAKPSLRNIM